MPPLLRVVHACFGLAGGLQRAGYDPPGQIATSSQQFLQPHQVKKLFVHEMLQQLVGVPYRITGGCTDYQSVEQSLFWIGGRLHSLCWTHLHPNCLIVSRRFHVVCYQRISIDDLEEAARLGQYMVKQQGLSGGDYLAVVGSDLLRGFHRNHRRPANPSKSNPPTAQVPVCGEPGKAYNEAAPKAGPAQIPTPMAAS